MHEQEKKNMIRPFNQVGMPSNSNEENKSIKYIIPKNTEIQKYNIQLKFFYIERKKSTYDIKSYQTIKGHYTTDNKQYSSTISITSPICFSKA